MSDEVLILHGKSAAFVRNAIGFLCPGASLNTKQANATQTLKVADFRIYNGENNQSHLTPHPLTRLQKYADIFCAQDSLIQDNGAPGNFEFAVDTTKSILSGSDENILIGFHPRTVNEKIGVDFNLGT